MLFYILCVVISLTVASPVKNFYSLEEGHELFESFIKEYNKQYEGKEKEERFQIFLENLKEINSLNEASSNAVFAITKFSDLTKDEFKKTYTGFKDDRNLSNRKHVKPQVPKSFNYTAPAEFDWRTKGVVSRVKNQANCGSCWAFSTTGNVESINAIKTGSMVEISEQQLVDCDTQSSGCSGGYPEKAMNYLVQNGAMSEQSYAYEGVDGSCRFASNNVVIKIQSVEHTPMDEPQIQEKLVSTGPLSIVINADVLQSYHDGILVKGCEATSLDHAVLLVGYGQENGVDYWIIKNSWDVSWGEQGYFRIKKGINCLNINSYGITTAVI